MVSNRFTVWGQLTSVAIIFLVSTLVAALCLVTLKSAFPGLEQALPIVYMVQFALAIAGASLYYSRRGTKPLFRLSFNWFDAPLTLLGIVLITAAGVVLEPVLSLFPDHYFESLGEAIGSGAGAILFSVVLAPLCEELFFRGLVLEQTSRRWSATAAVFASALFFGAVHLPNLPQALNALVMAVVMGYIYILTRSLIPVIAIHAVNNGIAYLQLQMTEGLVSTRDMIGNEPLYRVIYAASAVILVVSLVLMALRAGNKTKKNTLHENNG